MGEISLTALVGERIRYYRNQYGWSQAKLAEKAGTSTNHIGQLERGEKNPTLTTLEKIATALNISLSRLFENISTTDTLHQNNELNEIYQALLQLPKNEQKEICDLINNIIKLIQR